MRPAGPSIRAPALSPPSRVVGSEIRDSLIAEGALVSYARVAILSSAFGASSAAVLPSERSVFFGADFYEGERPLMTRDGIGGGRAFHGDRKGLSIECAIIDKNVRIGDDVTIREKMKGEEYRGQWHWVRDGVTIIPKGTVIPSGTEI